MQSFFRVSITLLHSNKPNKLPFLRNLMLSYHSLNHITASPGISLPERDYSADSVVARSNWLITKLSRQGKIHEARSLFDIMRDRDVITWTTVISGYIKCGLIEEARRLFDRVDAMKNVVTWTAMLSGYVTLHRMAEAENLFDIMPVKNVVSWNVMISGYAQKGNIDSVLDVFERMPERNVVSWNTVINALVQCGRVEEARRLFGEMPYRDVISWTAMVAGLAKSGRVDEAREVFDRTPERNIVSWNAMITGYAQNKRLDEAFELFERMPERDLPSWNTMITGFIQNGQLSRARELFDDMPEKNVVSWTTMITGYVQQGESEAALKIFMEMTRDGGVRPNDVTFVNVLGACSDLAGLGEGQQVHQMISKNACQDGVFVVSALINMYSKCGDLGTARKMFDDGMASQRDLVSWNSMIAAYAHYGCGREAIDLYHKMQSLGFKPNDVTYVGLLSACSHAGLAEDGLKYFDELVQNSSIQLREDHYTCLVDLCGRVGRLKEAYEFIVGLGTKPSSSIWLALLAACNVHGDLEIAQLASKELLKEEPDDPGIYLLLSSIYAFSGKWKEARGLRLEMKDKGLKKQPGCSWIDVGNKVHVFLACDECHSESDHIYSVLHDLHEKMKKAGHVSKVEFTMNDDFW